MRRHYGKSILKSKWGYFGNITTNFLLRQHTHMLIWLCGLGHTAYNTTQKVNIMQNVKMATTVTHSPRTQFNAQVWQAVQNCKGINTAAGVPFATLQAHIVAKVPQSPHHATAHIKYLLRSKGALVAVAAKGA